MPRSRLAVRTRRWLGGVLALTSVAMPGCAPDSAGSLLRGQMPRLRPRCGAPDFLAIRVAVASCQDSSARARLMRSWLDTLRVRPAHPCAHYAVGLSSLALGLDSLALQHLLAAATSAEADGACYADLAEAARRVGALSSVAEALASEPAPPALAQALLMGEAGLWDSAAALAQVAAKMHRQTPDVELLLARVARAQGNWDGSLAHASASLKAAARRRDEELVVRSLDALAMAHRLRGETTDAERTCREALRRAIRGGLRHLEAPIRCELGFLLLLMGDPAQAAETLRTAHDVARAVGDLQCAGWALKLHSDALARMGDFGVADSLLREALLVLCRVRDREGEGACLDALAGLELQRGRPEQAVERYEHARAFHTLHGHRAAEAATTVHLGWALVACGRYDQAVLRFDEARDLCRAVGDFANVTEASLGLAEALLALGQLSRAQEVLRGALRAAILRGDVRTAARALSVGGAVALRGGDPSHARNHFALAARILGQFKDPRPALQAQVNLGISLLSRDLAAAREILNRSRDVAIQAGDSHTAAVCVAGLGEAALRSGRYVTADSLFVLCSSVAAARPDPDLMWFSRYGLARSAEARGDVANTIRLYQEALELIEETRGSLHAGPWRSSFLASKREVYERYVAVLATLHEADPSAGFAARALVVAERAKARTHLDALLGPGLQGPTGGDASAARTSAPGELSRVSGALSAPAGPWRDAAGPPREAAPGGNGLGIPPTGWTGIKAAQVRDDLVPALQEAMPDHGVGLILEYFVGEEASFLWAVSPDSVRLTRLPPRRELTDLVATFLDWAAHPPCLHAPVATPGTLSEVILPSAEVLTGCGGAVCVVGDGPLQAIPFEALPLGSGSGAVFLVEARAVSYALSASSLLVLWSRERPWRPDPLLVVAIRAPLPPRPRGREGRGAGSSVPDMGSPGPDGSFRLALAPLDWVEAEAKAVTQLFDKRRVLVLLAADATEGRVVGELQRGYGTAHLATHSLVDSRSPWGSCVVLNPGPGPRDDGILVLDDITRMSSVPSLVVLSSCGSATGEVVAGEGVMSLARAFLTAGSTGVLASLWPVNDRSTALWMERFYERLASGSTRVHAVRDTKVAFLRGNTLPLRHPYHWAAFVLMGCG